MGRRRKECQIDGMTGRSAAPGMCSHQHCARSITMWSGAGLQPAYKGEAGPKGPALPRTTNH